MLMKRIGYLFILLCLGTFSTALAQDAKIKTVFETLKWNYYQEKLYLHIDKPYYTAGEKIWLKAYLRDARTLSPGMSNFVYVELINKSDSVLNRVKIRKDSINGFSGFLPISDDIPSGDYQVRGYSWWMQNAGEDFFFKRNVSIENVGNKRVQLKSKYTADGNKIKVSLSFTDASGNPLSGKEFDAIIQGKTAKYIRTDKEGKAEFTIDVKDKDKRMFYDVQAYKNPDEYNQRYYVPFLLDDYDVSFFPEGGHLLVEEPQFVAFKTLGSDGLSRAVSGTIHSENGEVVAQIETVSKGMGKFMLSPNPGTRYYAEVTDKNGLKKRFNLPEVEQTGINMQTSKRGNTLRIKINNKTSVPSDSLLLIAHLRGIPLATMPLKEGALLKSLDLEGVPPGIITLAVTDQSLRTFCERLVFVYPQESKIDMNTNKPVYKRRDAVELDFLLQDKDGNPISGDFSLSVSDLGAIIPDSLGGNIVSDLLLTSDLRGTIEDPGYYFASNENSKKEALDLLLMTQGWTRFDLKDAIAKPVPEYPYEMEIGQIVSGTVQTLMGKPYPNAEVVLFSHRNNTMSLGVSDKDGRYYIAGIAFPDSTEFSVQSLNKKGEAKSTQIVPDKDVFPAAHTFIPDLEEEQKKQLAEYKENMRNRYIAEGGLRMIYLDEVEIVQKKKNNDPDYAMMKNSARQTITSKDIEDKYIGQTFWDILSQMPFVQVEGYTATTRNQNIQFVLDQMGVDGETMNMYSVTDMENIYLLTDQSVVSMYSSSGAPIIRVVLKQGATSRPKSSLGLTMIKPLGFQKPSAFYVPSYELEKDRNSTIPDLRATLYWAPTLTSDESGHIRTRFYAADKNDNYQVILEGISKNGEVLRYSGVIKRE